MNHHEVNQWPPGRLHAPASPARLDPGPCATEHAGFSDGCLGHPQLDFSPECLRYETLIILIYPDILFFEGSKIGGKVRRITKVVKWNLYQPCEALCKIQPTRLTVLSEPTPLNSRVLQWFGHVSMTYARHYASFTEAANSLAKSSFFFFFCVSQNWQAGIMRQFHQRNNSDPIKKSTASRPSTY